MIADCKFGNLPSELLNRVNHLSIEQLESLGEALFDFNSIVDLENWLDNQSNARKSLSATVKNHQNQVGDNRFSLICLG